MWMDTYAYDYYIGQHNSRLFWSDYYKTNGHHYDDIY